VVSMLAESVVLASLRPCHTVLRSSSLHHKLEHGVPYPKNDLCPPRIFVQHTLAQATITIALGVSPGSMLVFIW
jgi:hypothetical protein